MGKTHNNKAEKGKENVLCSDGEQVRSGWLGRPRPLSGGRVSQSHGAVRRMWHWKEGIQQQEVECLGHLTPVSTSYENSGGFVYISAPFSSLRACPRSQCTLIPQLSLSTREAVFRMGLTPSAFAGVWITGIGLYPLS